MRNKVYESQLQTTNKIRQMVTTKAASLILAIIGFPMLGISWLDTMDHTKSTIIFIVGMSITLVSFYFTIISRRLNNEHKQIRNDRDRYAAEKERLENIEKQIELQERQHRLNNN